nr:MAG TPA: YopX protein [Caudoviricetes sp.]
MKIGNIKFKAKCLDNGEWEKGSLVITNLIGCDEPYAEIVTTDGMRYEVDPSTVCQFTGLKDFYAEEVWEGDIIENPEFPFEKRTVTWFDCVLGFVPMDEDECQDRDVSFLVLFKKWKVVGNKFDRKEGEK